MTDEDGLAILVWCIAACGIVWGLVWVSDQTDAWNDDDERD